jgi:CBS domain-containing protein
MHDIAEFLKDHDPFSGLDAAALDQLAERVKVEFFAAGTTIFRQGEGPQEEVRVIRKGAIELVDHGRVLDLLGEGELFGHPSMVSGLPTGFEARAHEDSLCYAVAAEDVLPLLTRPAGLRYLARSLLERPKPGPVVAADVSGFDLAQQPVRALIRDQPLICEPDVSLRDAAGRMADAGAGSVLVRLEDGQFGIVTDQDLRRVVAGGVSVDAPVKEAMSAPAFTVGPELNGVDVLLAMLDHGIRHVPVLSERGEVLGVVSDIDLLAAETRTPFVLRRAIADARDIEELRRAARRVNPTLIGLHQADVHPSQISAVTSVVVDTLVRRTIELATATVGSPPTEFAWLALGSHGRREAVPSSDVDSGMAWPTDPASDPTGYMHAIADQVITMLAATGWRPDPHGVTAAGSIAAHSVAGWQREIGLWLDPTIEADEVMAISIMLDARVVYGPEDAFGALATLQGARNQPRVLRLLLRLALTSKPPTGFMRDFVVEHSGEHRGSLDIKHGGVLPVVAIARYAALAAGVRVTSTVERLRASAAEGILPEPEARILEEAYDLFEALRLEHQVHQLEAGVPPDNHVDPGALNPLTRRYLRDAFRVVASVQKRLAGELVWTT